MVVFLTAAGAGASGGEEKEKGPTCGVRRACRGKWGTRAKKVHTKNSRSARTHYCFRLDAPSAISASQRVGRTILVYKCWSDAQVENVTVFKSLVSLREEGHSHRRAGGGNSKEDWHMAHVFVIGAAAGAVGTIVGEFFVAVVASPHRPHSDNLIRKKTKQNVRLFWRNMYKKGFSKENKNNNGTIDGRDVGRGSWASGRPRLRENDAVLGEFSPVFHGPA